MTVQIDDIVRINANFEFDNSELYTNVFNFKVTKNNTADDGEFMDAIAQEMDDLYTFINGEVGVDLAYTDVTGQNITQDVILPDRSWPSLTVGGEAVANVLPLQVSPCVFFRTTRPKTRASKFLAGYTQASNDGAGVLESSAKAALQLFGDSFVAGITTTEVDAIYGAFNKVADRFTPVISAVVAATFRTQRRRRAGVGQ